MTTKPHASLQPNSWAFENEALIKPTGFREYDARWWFGHPGSDKPSELNLYGVQALGLGLGTLIHELGVEPKIVVGHDFRSYSLSVKQALEVGLMAAGVEGAKDGLFFFGTNGQQANAWGNGTSFQCVVSPCD